jgi:hypothetical protein
VDTADGGNREKFRAEVRAELEAEYRADVERLETRLEYLEQRLLKFERALALV